ncbi:hypothetical protein PAI11_44040 [Patulibacter medicamentivorans]|jgi:hypothetical protein|uniref:Lipoprotein n=1 Tax=Patulibacter medicamentivorans TaxID=1097667 RepID=H0EC19_9ACTN|nr:hypothetical protein [Patulibacter medicamentivorans]EHN08772.1 hypothetical protein PAI11_44040 [Patulibacter medicamentivorans]
MRQRLIPLLAVALSATALTACGSKQEVVTSAETEAIFVSVGPDGGPYLKYQVQISRQLNPGDFENVAAKGDPEKVDAEDSEYLRGLTPQEAALAKRPSKIDDEVFFGVWIAAYNDTKKPLLSAAADGFEIVDTQGEKFEPFVAKDPRNPPNPFLYRQATVPAAVGSGSGVLPEANSPAGASTTQGELLLFKIPQSSLENRPLVLHIKGPSGGEAEVDLDV